MSRNVGLRPKMSGHMTTAGCLALPAGWNRAASHVPSGVLISTSVSTTSVPAALAAPEAASPAATDPAANPRRDTPGLIFDLSR